VIGFGGIPVGSLHYSEAEKVLKHAVKMGINFFDTTPNYGASEQHMGRALEDYRENCIIATKTEAKTRADAATSGLDESLKKLRTSYIDLIQLHDIDSRWTLEKVMATGGVLEALKEARKQAKVRFIGITSHRPPILMDAIKSGEFDTVMAPFNLGNQEAAKELISLAKELDVGIIIMKPFRGRGSIWSPRTISLQPISDGLYQSARKHLGYILNHSISTTIPGLRSTAEVDAAVKVGE
jgi:aryl-alcohol dehydrogenase-like predicted oxidoreductase